MEVMVHLHISQRYTKEVDGGDVFGVVRLRNDLLLIMKLALSFELFTVCQHIKALLDMIFRPPIPSLLSDTRSALKSYAIAKLVDAVLLEQDQIHHFSSQLFVSNAVCD